MLSLILLNVVYADCYYAECYNFNIMLSAVMLSVLAPLAQKSGAYIKKPFTVVMFALA